MVTDTVLKCVSADRLRLLQYMVTYQILLSLAINMTFFLDGSYFNLPQVILPPTCTLVPVACCIQRSNTEQEMLNSLIRHTAERKKGSMLASLSSNLKQAMLH